MEGFDDVNLAKDPEALDRYRALLANMATIAERIMEGQREPRRVQREARRVQRENAPRAELTLESLIAALNDKYGGPEFTLAYAEHLVQSYCTCENDYDGWSICDHWRDIENENKNRGKD